MSRGQVCYVLVNPGGAYLGADLYVIDVEVADGAKLLLATQSATKIYRTPGSFAEQRMRLRLGEGAQLELAPDQADRLPGGQLPAEHAHHDASDVEPDHGRDHHPGVVAGRGLVPVRGTAVADRDPGRADPRGAGGLLALDNLLIRPPQHDVTGMGFMEGFSHLGSLIVVDRRVDQALADELHVVHGRARRLHRISLTATVMGSAVWCSGRSRTAPRNSACPGAATALLRQALVRPGSAGSEEVLMAGTQ